MLLDLDAPACRDPLVAGAKAARLALARAGGLPVLPGVVVPVHAARDAHDRGLALAARDGHHAARLEVMAAGVGAALADALRRAGPALGGRLAVRSSSPLEATTVWSGAFTSYLGVGPEELPTAVAGCWASALGTGALERAAHLGVDPARLALAVLVQPEVTPAVSGTAEVMPDGTVTVVGVTGAPAALLAGHRAGVTVTVRAGEVTAGRAELLGRDTVLAAAALAERVNTVLGDDVIEWAAEAEGAPPAGQPTPGIPGPSAPGSPTPGRVLLLQSTRASRPPAPAPPAHLDPPPGALRIARLLHHFGDATGEALILPWIAALPELPELPELLELTELSELPEPSELSEPPELPAPPATAGGPRAAGAATPSAATPGDGTGGVGAAGTAGGEGAGGTNGGTDELDEARALAAELTAAAWQAPAPVAMARAARTLAELRGPAPGPALERLERLAPVDPARARRLLALVAPARTARSGPAPRIAGRWEPFVHAAVLAGGERVQGSPAAPGTAAGPVVLVDGAGTGPLPPRAVCLARYPLPQLAPLLWGAAALVTEGGSSGAHVVGVARSLGVPAVVACGGVMALIEAGGPYLAAVDGGTGVVALAPAIATRAAPRATP